MATKEIKNEEKNYLENKVVEVRPIPRENAIYASNIAMLEGALVKMDLPIDPATRSRVEIFESDEEQEWFERKLNQPKGSLSLYNLHNPFWRDYVVNIYHDGLVLNLANVADLLKYKVLKANSHRIAPSWENRDDDRRFTFAFVEKGSENIEINRIEDKKKKAYVFIASIENSVEKMINVLNTVGKKIDRRNSGSADFLKAELYKLITEANPYGELSGVDKLLSLAEDKDFHYKVLIDKALQAKALSKVGRNGYKLFHADDEDLIADDTKELILWLKNPKNEAKVQLIEAQIEEYFK